MTVSDAGVQMLHVGRTKGPALDCKLGRTLLSDLTKRHSFYATPKGSNDDWWVCFHILVSTKLYGFQRASVPF